VAAVGIQAIGFLWLRESHPATLLRTRRDSLAKKTGNEMLYVDGKADRPIYTLAHAFEKPVMLFCTQPIVFCMAV
jgi:hypothetical protein